MTELVKMICCIDRANWTDEPARSRKGWIRTSCKCGRFLGYRPGAVGGTDFETDFWAHYPRKVAKQNARKAWAKLSDDQKRAAVAAVVEFKDAPIVTQSDKSFICHPATWLNSHRWEDDRSEWQTPMRHEPLKTPVPRDMTRVIDPTRDQSIEAGKACKAFREAHGRPAETDEEALRWWRTR